LPSLDDDLGVVAVVSQVIDHGAHDLALEALDERDREIVRQGALARALLDDPIEDGDLDDPDPDRELPRAVGLAQRDLLLVVVLLVHEHPSELDAHHAHALSSRAADRACGARGPALMLAAWKDRVNAARRV